MKDGRTELDDLTYAGFFQQQVKQYLDQGMWLDQANQLAREYMENTFIMRSDAMQNECQHDYCDERQEDWTR